MTTVCNRVRDEDNREHIGVRGHGTAAHGYGRTRRDGAWPERMLGNGSLNACQRSTARPRNRDGHAEKGIRRRPVTQWTAHGGEDPSQGPGRQGAGISRRPSPRMGLGDSALDYTRHTGGFRCVARLSHPMTALRRQGALFCFALRPGAYRPGMPVKPRGLETGQGLSPRLVLRHERRPGFAESPGATAIPLQRRCRPASAALAEPGTATATGPGLLRFFLRGIEKFQAPNWPDSVCLAR
jgi:hypothetical protein